MALITSQFIENVYLHTLKYAHAYIEKYKHAHLLNYTCVGVLSVYIFKYMYLERGGGGGVTSAKEMFVT